MLWLRLAGRGDGQPGCMGRMGQAKKILSLLLQAPPGPCHGAQDILISNLSHHRSSKILFACVVRVLQGYVAHQGSARSTQ